MKNYFYYTFTLSMTLEIAWLRKTGNQKNFFGHHLSAFIRLHILRHPSLYIQTKSGVFSCIYCESLRDSQILLGVLFTSFSWPITREFKERAHPYSMLQTRNYPAARKEVTDLYPLFNLSADFQLWKMFVSLKYAFKMSIRKLYWLMDHIWQTLLLIM